MDPGVVKGKFGGGSTRDALVAGETMRATTRELSFVVVLPNTPAADVKGTVCNKKNQDRILAVISVGAHFGDGHHLLRTRVDMRDL
jgi:hypothetical protein